jgi:Na+-driven multidrug efflux pump
MGSALRGTGIVKPAMAIQAFTVLLNALLAPILIAGWGTGIALGVAGAGLASTVSIVIGVVLLGLYFVKLEKYVSFRRDLWRPQFHVWKRMLDVGLPAGGEFALLFIYMGVIYWVISDFGAARQAGGIARGSCNRSSCPRALHSRPDRSQARTSAPGAAHACARRSTKP